jgi:hypothetical protein
VFSSVLPSVCLSVCPFVASFERLHCPSDLSGVFLQKFSCKHEFREPPFT